VEAYPKSRIPATPGFNGTGRVGADQRHTATHPCPICGGSDRDRRGQGSRCHGFTSADGQWCHCSREDHAGGAKFNERSGTWAHKLKGPCPCGREHAPADLDPRRDGQAKPKPPPSGKGKIVATYDYRDAGGKVLFQAVRYDPKDFRQRRPNDKGGWIWNLDGVAIVPYRLPELLDADPAETVWIPEGEKDVDRLRSLGRVTTCNPMGAEKWRDELSPHLRGRHVVILADNDAAGRRHVEKVARSVAPHAASVKVIDLAEACRRLGLGELPEKGDVSDLLDLGGTVEDLERLAAAGGFVSFVGAQGEGSPEFTGPPQPVVPVLRPVPSLHPEQLPMPMRAWVSDIAQRAQCSPEFPAIGALIVLAALVGRKVALRPKRCDAWTVVPNLWGLIVGRPGVLKTHALEQSMGPLDRLAAAARERHAEAIEEYQRELMVIEVKKDAAKGAMKKAAAKPGVPDAVLRDLARGATNNPDLPQPVERRYKTNDTTVEKLGELLRDNLNGLLIYRDELTGFLRTLDKQGHESDRAFYLEAWNGTGTFTYDRIGRGTVHIPAVCLSILGGIQPGPLASYVRHAIRGEGDDGLISRFQLAVYPDQDRPFRVVDRQPDVGAKNRAHDVFKALDALEPADIGAEVDEAGGIPYLRFAPDAQEYFYRWWAALEAKLRANEPPAIESHLSKYRSLMPSLALLFHLVDLVDGERGEAVGKGPVSLEAARRAAEWCDFLEQHARRIYQSGSDGDMVPAQTLAERIAESLPSPFRARDVVRKGWTGLTSADDVDRALGILEEHGWVRPVEAPAGDKGGRPTVEYHINPAAISGDTPPKALTKLTKPPAAVSALRVDPEALAEREAIQAAEEVA
jgi:hypothetical protein